MIGTTILKELKAKYSGCLSPKQTSSFQKQPYPEKLMVSKREGKYLKQNAIFAKKNAIFEVFLSGIKKIFNTVFFL